MSTTADKLVSEIRGLPDLEKLRLVDAILTDMDKSDPEIDRIWAEEARKRWQAYKDGRLPTVAYEEVMANYIVDSPSAVTARGARDSIKPGA